MFKMNIEYTDTYAGEANYCWVKRSSISLPPDASRALIMRRAKRAMGLSGVRGRVDDWGDLIKFTPYRSCTVLFAAVDYL